jgi:signal transduction histidine kinase
MSLQSEEQIEQIRDNFVSLVAHQLRAPLGAILWFNEIAMDGTSKLDKDQQDALITINETTRSMISLVDMMLTISRVESRAFTITPVAVDIKELIHQSITEVEPLARAKEIRLSYDSPKSLTLPLDPVLMGHVLRNLLTNAIRYSSDKDGRITVASSAYKGQLVITVSDNGIGIPDDAKEHIFEQFYRATNAKMAVRNGSGLGLYLAKSIIQQAGGTIGFDSRHGQGTTFTITIPRSGMTSKKALGA